MLCVVDIWLAQLCPLSPVAPADGAMLEVDLNTDFTPPQTASSLEQHVLHVEPPDTPDQDSPSPARRDRRSRSEVSNIITLLHHGISVNTNKQTYCEYVDCICVLFQLRWRASGGGLAGRQSSLSRFVGKHERERRDRIERDNQILLRKILDCHHGVDRDRTSNIPTPDGHRRKTEESRRTPRRLATSNQINTKRIKQRTDYENLLLLQKIQNVKPSSSVRKAFC